MMQLGRIELPFTNGFYQSRSRALSSQRCINWYPNALEVGALSESNLFPTPGIEQVATGGGINRGSWLLNRKPYFVNGETLYRLNRTVDADLVESYTLEDLGTIPGSQRVRMASNASQLCIVVPGESSYIYTEGGPLVEITDPDFNGPVDDVVQINSLFVFCKTGDNIVFESNLNDGTSYNILNSEEITQVPRVVGLMVFRNQLYAMGDSLTVPLAPLTNPGAVGLSFQRIPNAVLDVGLASVHAKTQFRESFAFVGSGENSENSVWLFTGRATKISTDPVDFELQNQTPESIDQSFMMRLSVAGAEFMTLTYGDRCLSYDVSVGLWHERESRIGDEDYRWRANSITQAYNRIFVGDAVDGRIGLIGESLRTEYGGLINRVLVTQPFFDGGNRVKARMVEAYVDTGNNEDDLLALRWSDDGGYTWSNKIYRGLGATGEYGRRVVFDRLGSFSNARTLRFEYSGTNQCSFNKLMAATE